MGSKLNCILLVDDDKLTNFVNKVVIETAGCSNYVIKKESVHSGLKYLIANAEDVDNFPEIIFLDIDMPQFTGWDFLDRYNQIKSSFVIEPLIYLLSVTRPLKDYSDDTKYQGLSGICEKPLTSELLNAIVRKHFSNI